MRHDKRKRQLDQQAQQRQRNTRKGKRRMPQPNMEEKRFTDAEMELFATKYAARQKAQEELNEIMIFLRKQHGISTSDPSWQIGERGFVKPIQEPPPPPPGDDDSGKNPPPPPVTPPPAPIEQTIVETPVIHAPAVEAVQAAEAILQDHNNGVENSATLPY